MRPIIKTPKDVVEFNEVTFAERNTEDPYKYVKQRNDAWYKGGSVLAELIVGHALFNFIKLILPTVFFFKVVFHYLAR